MSVDRDTMARVHGVSADYVCCENCVHNGGLVVGNIIDCTFWNTRDLSTSKNDFCSFWKDKQGETKNDK